MNSEILIEIIVKDGDKVISKSILDQSKIVIGRILSADFRIPDRRISRIHAMLELVDGRQLRITDLSTHGTFVNDERVVERIISTNDKIKFATLEATIKIINVEVSTESSASVTKAFSDGGHKPNILKAPKNPTITPIGGSDEVKPEVDPQGQIQIKTQKEATVIRSLKNTARTRGVLDQSGLAEEVEVTVYWENTVLNVDHYRCSKRSIYIGENPDNEYCIPSEGLGKKFKFIDVSKKQIKIFLHPSIQGSVRVDGKLQNLKDHNEAGIKEVILKGHDIAKLRVGNVNFFIMFVPEPPTIPMGPIFDGGKMIWSFLGAACIFGIFLLAFSFKSSQTIKGEVREIPDRFRKILVKRVEKKLKITEKKSGNESKKKSTKQTGGNSGEGAKEKGNVGKRGTKTSKNKTGIQNRPKVPKVTKTYDAPKKAVAKPAKTTKKSLLNSLKKSGLSSKIAKLGGGGGAAGNDPLDKVLQGVGGGQQSSGGSGGSGLSGVGGGGGGTVEGVGGLGTKGFGGGARGSGKGSIPGKGKYMIGTESSGVSVAGGLSKEEVRRAVMTHKNEVDFCYRQALQRNPSLFGKVKIKWTIVPGGAAQSLLTASNSTGDKLLADCIKRKLRTWRFPSPRNGSSVDVQWPWTFQTR